MTQSAFAPPLGVLGVKTDSGVYKTVKAAQTFALNSRRISTGRRLAGPTPPSWK